MSSEAKDCGTTRLLTASGTYKWSIQNFKNWLKSDTICSPTFTFPLINSAPFQLYLQKSAQEGYLHIRLELYSQSPSIFITFFTQKGAKRMCEHSSIHSFYIEGTYYSYDHQTFLHESSISDLLCDDTLTIYCEIKMQKSEIASKTKALQNVDDPRLKIPIDLKNLLDSETFSDIIIISSCGKKFQVHKNILAARSTVFSAMLENNMKEATENLVEITDIDAETLEELLLFIYSGKVKNIERAAIDLLAASDKYAIEDLKIMCEKVLDATIGFDNAVDVFVLADLHHADLLKQKALSFITKHLKIVMETPAFKALMNGTQPHLSEILTAISKTK